MNKRFVLCLATIGLMANLANAQNLLLNGDFNNPNSVAAAANWSTWSYGGGYMADGGGSSAGGGEFQTVSGTAGTTYTLAVDSGAQAWWLPYGEMRMFFLDAGNNQLSGSFKPTVDPVVYGQNFDIAHPWSHYTLTATAPANTTQIKVEFAEPNGTGSVWFDNAVLTAVPEPSTLALVGFSLLAGHVYQAHRRFREVDR